MIVLAYDAFCASGERCGNFLGARYINSEVTAAAALSLGNTAIVI